MIFNVNRLRNMNRMAFFVMIISILCIAGTNCYDKSNDWRPIVMPLPGSGLEIIYPFNIGSGGKFELRVLLPALPSERELAIPCDWEVGIYNENIMIENLNIKKIIYIGNGPFDVFSGGYLTIKKSGNLKLKFKNLKYSEILAKRGAAFELSRTGNPADLIVASILQRSFGWFLAVLGTCLFAVCEMSRNKPQG